MTMGVRQRGYRDEDDYWRIRAFLREVFLLNNRTELSWQTARLDYWRWHGIRTCGHVSEEGISIWETTEGRIAAVVTPESRGEAFLHVHPAFKTPALEERMIAAAEERLAVVTPEGERKLRVWAFDQDAARGEILRRRDYTPEPEADQHRRRLLLEPVPAPPAVPGCALRSLAGSEELPSRSWASWRAFHPEDPDDRYDGWEWYRNIQETPLYRRDLDLVGVTEDGKVAAFCTLWYDDVTRTGYFEPVGRKPECRQRGLMRALLLEAMRRAQRMGATAVTVAESSFAANTLYAAVTSLHAQQSRAWVKNPGQGRRRLLRLSVGPGSTLRAPRRSPLRRRTRSRRRSFPTTIIHTIVGKPVSRLHDLSYTSSAFSGTFPLTLTYDRS